MRKNGWLIYRKEDAIKNKGYIDWMLSEADDLEMSLAFHEYETIEIGHHNHALYLKVNGDIVERPDFAIVRTIDPFFTKQLEMLGTTCFNSSAIAEMANNKAKTHQALTELQIPMADTVYCRDGVKAQLPFPFIVKEVHGRGGKSVYLVNNEADLAKIPTSGEWIIQKPGVFGKDVRVFVVGKTIIAAVLRQSASNFKANYTLGGTATLYDLSVTERSLVEKIINTFDFGMVGIDFIFDEAGNFLFNEIEDVVGSRTLSNLSKINIVKKYLIYIKSKA